MIKIVNTMDKKQEDFLNAQFKYWRDSQTLCKRYCFNV